MAKYFFEEARSIPNVKKIKGRGLMLGLEFAFPVAELRKKLIFEHKIFTGSSKNPNVLRVLPPLTVKKQHINQFIEALKQELETYLKENSRALNL